LQSCFRLLESFAGLLSRPAIQKDFEKKYTTLLTLYTKDLDDVNAIFIKFKDNPPMHYNAASVSGAIAWSRELKDRIEKSMEKLVMLNQSLMESEDAASVKEKYDSLLRLLGAYENKIFRLWAEGVIDQTEANLSKPLLVRSQDGLLSVNFDAAVVCLLREVKYLRSYGIQVPEKAAHMFAEGEKLRQHIFELEHIVGLYNSALTTVLDVERPLVEKRIEEIDNEVMMVSPLS
jgi:dynein heavy chain